MSTTRPKISLHEIFHVFFFSFAHSQGRLILQPDIFSFLASSWRENNIEIDFEMKEGMLEKIQQYHPPRGHREVDENEAKAQFGFWWENMWDIFTFQGLDPKNPVVLPPSELDLQTRSKKFSGNDAYEKGIFLSLRADKMKKISDRIALNDPKLGSQALLSTLLLPNILSVEMYFQGYPKYDGPTGRQRTDGKDELESKLLLHSKQALTKKHANEKLTPYDEMYLRIHKYLENILNKKSRLTKQERAIVEDYKKLLELYNENHKDNQVEYLYK